MSVICVKPQGLTIASLTSTHPPVAHQCSASCRHLWNSQGERDEGHVPHGGGACLVCSWADIDGLADSEAGSLTGLIGVIYRGHSHVR